ncbi:hypothetical protein J6590_020983 [Homalodisca vitripennis]|nr:hypothetical protein J6590_020983 [Homalodisca vitripennis]
MADNRSGTDRHRGACHLLLDITIQITGYFMVSRDELEVSHRRWDGVQAVVDQKNKHMFKYSVTSATKKLYTQQFQSAEAVPQITTTDLRKSRVTASINDTREMRFDLHSLTRSGCLCHKAVGYVGDTSCEYRNAGTGVARLAGHISQIGGRFTARAAAMSPA